VPEVSCRRPRRPAGCVRAERGRLANRFRFGRHGSGPAAFAEPATPSGAEQGNAGNVMPVNSCFSAPGSADSAATALRQRCCTATIHCKYQWKCNGNTDTTGPRMTDQALQPFEVTALNILTELRAMQHEARANDGHNNRGTRGNKPGWNPTGRSRSATPQ
jgi:hypothetical protein